MFLDLFALFVGVVDIIVLTRIEWKYN